MNLSKHFTLEELVQSDIALQEGIANTPTEKEIENLKLLCNSTLEYLRDILDRPLIITSGYRSFFLNSAVGGFERSHHLEGKAADFVASKEDQSIVLNALKHKTIALLKFDQIIFYPKRNFVHCSYNKGSNRCEVFSCSVRGKYHRMNISLDPNNSF